jgi:membrane protein YqaA with SNARE-associated domain
MHAILQALIHFFFALGGAGLVLLGILDSSFLMLPLGNDLLLVALTASNPDRMYYYAIMATIGSTVGVIFCHYVCSRMGEKALGKKTRQIAYVERKVEKYGGLAIGFAALAPPGFPFTPFIVVPSVLHYPVKKMAAIIFGCRLVRFLVEGSLARVYGRHLLRMAKSPVVTDVVLVIMVISLVGSAISIWGWVKKGRSRQALA